MNRLLRPLKKLPELLDAIRIGLNKDKLYSEVNLYFQDESRFGLMTHIGKSLTAKGVKPIVKYQHAFKNTYLYGSFSPINGDSFVYEIEGVSSEIFYKYLLRFSEYKPEELKIIIIDNAGFHSMKEYTLPANIKLIRIPPYTPELNPSEKMWQHIKQYYKNKVFGTLDAVKQWLHLFIRDNINTQIVKSITHSSFFNESYKKCFDI
ncbi:IS630 family transposase [Ancylomarina euxinus]|uniref:IS630 family transposase n=1 Tax=Ancylomarina euxinus TaxID=2283627 RepID=A0A425XWB9_9BACT|nr:IS630 family transposase [Ancylomarina euxinus]MCZ4693708.1 IS630 family transposase [Ancylomarina euxinus]MUP16860.1 IS630 family transposase [Ancylomarina euxinus]RRG18909.1 IS630 family transposase [Ancylomarina euxinus]